MKKIIRQSFALILIGALLCVGMPFAIAEEPSSTYTGVDYSTILTLGEKNDRLIESVPSISTDDWNGYPLGYTVALEAGKEYVFSVEASADAATYSDRALAIFPETFSGNGWVDDCLAYRSTYQYKNSCQLFLSFSPETSGNYKVLAWGYCTTEDEKGNVFDLFGEGTLVSVKVVSAPEEPDLILDIDSEEDLAGLAAVLESHPEALWPQINFLADLDMKDTEYSLPGTDALYKITAKGNGHTVAGMTSPLFGNVFSLEMTGLTLKSNLTLEAPEEDTSMYSSSTGLVANEVALLNVSDCLVEGSISFDNYYDVACVGGLVGYVTDSALIDSTDSRVNISLNAPAYCYNTGGLVGLMETGYLTRCTWEGKIEILNATDDISKVGGLLGFGSRQISLGKCSAQGSIQITGREDIYLDNYEKAVGGLVGSLDDYSSIQSCHAQVDIDAVFMDMVGGLVGRLYYGNDIVNSFAQAEIVGDESVGGLVGLSESDGGNRFFNCYATGSVTASDCIGGLIGIGALNDTWYNCYTTHTVTAQPPYTPEGSEGSDPLPLEESSESPMVLYQGTFAGRLNAAGEEKPAFTTVFVAKQEGLPLAGNMVDEELSGITAVDFSADETLQTITDALNGKAEEYNALETGIFVLLPWGGKNEAGGPIFQQAVYGDVDGNDKVDAADALKALQHAVKLVTLEEAQYVAADVSGDDKVDATDALLMLQYTVKLIDKFPVE